MYKKVFCLGTLILLIIVFCSCGKSQEEMLRTKLIGKWQCVQSNDAVFKDLDLKIAFLNDNTYLSGSRHGKWNILDDGRIKLIDLFGNLAFVKFEGDKLFMYEHFNYKKNNLQIYLEKIDKVLQISPKHVIEKMFKLAHEGDIKAKHFFLKETDELVAFLFVLKGDKGEHFNYKITSEKVNGNKAEVTVYNTLKGGTSVEYKITLINDVDWRIASVDRLNPPARLDLVR